MSFRVYIPDMSKKCSAFSLRIRSPTKRIDNYITKDTVSHLRRIRYSTPNIKCIKLLYIAEHKINALKDFAR